MPTLNRRGFTLIELLIALSIGAAVATVVYQSIVGTQRATQAGTAQVSVRQNLRMGVAYLGSVVRELNAPDGDILVANATQLRFKSARWTGFLCAAPLAASMSAVTLPIGRNALYGIRGPDAALDSAFVFLEGDPATRTDDSWVAGGVTAVGAGACADASVSADLTVDFTASGVAAATVVAAMTLGSPLKGFQLEEISLLSSGGRWWMAQRTANRGGAWTTPAPRPLIGPLEAAGMALTYFDTTGTATATLTDIASVAVVLRGESRNRVRQGMAAIDFARDSLLTRIALRNNPRF
jgi:prepilin-type N-terminal cleavage/methylation domain-containing protein